MSKDVDVMTTKFAAATFGLVFSTSVVAIGLIGCTQSPDPTSVPTVNSTQQPVASAPQAKIPAPIKTPTASPSPTPTETPSPLPTETPVPPPTETPSPLPTETPVPPPTETPTPLPTDTPVPPPTETPSPLPTDTPVPPPTKTPTPLPTDTPVPPPTETPTPLPTDTPVPPPTETPTPLPTDTPVPPPTETPTPIPEEETEKQPANQPSRYSTTTDRAALAVIYAMTDGPNWLENSLWLTNRPLGDWYGVVTDANGRVVELKLEGNGLKGEIPKDVGVLSELRTLSLWRNNVSGTIPPEIGDLPKLRSLFLDDNQLSGEIPEELGRLKSVFELWLSGNQISGGIPTSIGHMTNLSRLILNDNMLSGPIPAELGQLEHLVLLNLGNNRLSGHLPQELGKASQLEALFVNDNQLTGKIPDELGDLENLVTFGVANSGIDSCFPRGLSEIPNIYSGEVAVEVCGSRSALNALYDATDGDNWSDRSNWLTDLPINSWHGVVADDRGHIFAINLARNNLNGTLPPELAELHKLRSLALFGNNLSGELPLELADLHELDQLFVGGNQLDGCIPSALENIHRTDLQASGIPSCSALLTGETTDRPFVALSAFSIAPGEANLTWHHDFESISAQIIYRDGEPIATPSVDQRTFSDAGLDPGMKHRYRIDLKLDDGAEVFEEADVATLASLPRLVAPIDVSEFGFSLAIVDDQNPTDTSYQVNLIGVDREYSSDWSGERCRTFAGLQPNHSYRVELRVRNQDLVETNPVLTWLYDSDPSSLDIVVTQPSSGNDDIWARETIGRLVEVYGLTDQALAWMLDDVRVNGVRDRPSAGGYFGEIEVGYPTGVKILSHEIMHGFWGNWPGFASDCWKVNHYRFRHDVAQFMLDFRDIERSGHTNPWKDWEPFYNFLLGMVRDNLVPQGEDTWSRVEEMRYRELWDGLYHIADTEFPTVVAGNLALIPPPLQPYFESFIAERFETTWADELRWYAGLTREDRRLWDNFYYYHNVAYYSPALSRSIAVEPSKIDETRRKLLVEADRQQFIDFINTLEDIVCETNCQELWDGKYAFWTYELEEHLHRYSIYSSQIEQAVGVELTRENLDAVLRGLETVVSDFFCGEVGASSARRTVGSLQGLTDLQRAALNQIIDQIADPAEGILANKAACRS